MRILQVCPRYSPYVGGMERVVKNLAEYLADKNHKVTVYATDSSNKLPELRVINGVTVKNYYALAPRENYYLPHLKMLIHLLKERTDLIHVHSVHDLTILMAYAAHRLNAKSKFVVSPYYHGGGHTKLAKILWMPYRFMLKEILKEADAIIVNSKIVQDEFNKIFKPNCRIFVVHDGVDLVEIANAKPLAFEENRRILLYVGRLEEYKNIHMTIGAMKHLAENYHFYIIGQGPFKNSLKSLVESRGLRNRVHFLGFQPDKIVRRWLKTAHAFVHLSTVESFGMTCIESLAAGTPVIANDDGFGLSETIDLYPACITRHKVRKQNSSKLAKLIIETAKLKPIAADVSRFSWKRIAEDIDAIYNQVVLN